MNSNIETLFLSDCLSLIIDNRGKTPKKLNTNWTDNGYRVVSANNVKFDGLEKEDSIRYVDEKTYRKWMTDEIKKGDILLTSEAPAGQVMYWNSDEKIVVGQRLFCLRVNEKMDSRYLKYYLQSKTGQFEITKNTTGSTVFGISAKMFAQIVVKAPELFTQKKIASILSTLDEKININNNINFELEEMAKNLYEYWFVQFDFPDASGKPYKSSGGKMMWNEKIKREIPNGWEVDQLKNHMEIERGISYKGTEINGGGVPMINLNSFYLNGNYKHSGIKYFSGKVNKNKVLRPYDFVVATTDVTRNAFIIGKSFILPDIFGSNDVVASCDVAKIVTGDKLDKYYLDMLFNSDYYHEYIKGFASGTLVLHLNTDGIDWYNVIIPPKKLLEKFAEIRKDIEKKRSVILKENQKIVELRDWLLPMLMNGQVAVG